MSETEKILVIDDHPIVLDGVILALKELMTDGEYITAKDGAEAINAIKHHGDIDWIFLDIKLPDIDGIELIKTFERKRVTANLIVFSSDSNPGVIHRALEQHANGFLSKSFTRSELRRCIKEVEQGKIFLTQEHRRQLKHYRDSILREKQLIENNMSDRQLQTLKLLASGYSNQEIAESLEIVESTVKSHVHALMALLNADNRTHCVAEARRLHIIS